MKRKSHFLNRLAQLQDARKTRETGVKRARFNPSATAADDGFAPPSSVGAATNARAVESQSVKPSGLKARLLDARALAKGTCTGSLRAIIREAEEPAQQMPFLHAVSLGTNESLSMQEEEEEEGIPTVGANLVDIAPAQSPVGKEDATAHRDKPTPPLEAPGTEPVPSKVTAPAQSTVTAETAHRRARTTPRAKTQTGAQQKQDTAPGRAPVSVTLVRPPAVPSAALMPDGPRARAVEKAFYDAWMLGPRDAARMQRRNPSPNPVSVSRASLHDLKPEDYVVAEKTDGVRYGLLLCRDHEGHPVAVMIDRAGRKFEVVVRAPGRYFDGMGTLLDGELAWERHIVVPASDRQTSHTTLVPTPTLPAADAPACVATNGCDDGPSKVTTAGAPDAAPGAHESSGTPLAAAMETRDGVGAGGIAPTETLVYWVFDAVCVADVSQRGGGADYYARMDQVMQALEGPDPDELIRSVPEANVHGLEFRRKPFEMAHQVARVWSEDVPRLRHGTDGIILTPIADPIQVGTHWRQFKWKHHHTFDLQLRGRRRNVGSHQGSGTRLCDQWTWGLFYLEADWTVPTAQSLARISGAECTKDPAIAPPPRQVGQKASDALVTPGTAIGSDAGASEAPCARYLNACKGITYSRTKVANASRERAAAATRQRRARGMRVTPPVATLPVEQTDDGTGAQKDRNKCLVVFALKHDDALETLVRQTLVATPDADTIRCVVECAAEFVDMPADWCPAHVTKTPPGGVRLLLCSIERLRTDKTDPNVRYTVRQTMLNIDEAIPYATVHAFLHEDPQRLSPF